MIIHVLTLFPDFFSSPFQQSILNRAQKLSTVKLMVHNLRDFTVDKHQTADDRPFGGGPGMVMLIEPIDRCLKSLNLFKGNPRTRILLTSAKGEEFSQQIARDLSELDEIAIICGHYEGVDERVVQFLIDQEIRVGNFVLTGGEIPALAMTDAVIRLIPGVLGNDQSPINESHSIPGISGFPQFSRPEVYQTWQVPPVLLSGDHSRISEWRENQKKKLT